MENQNQSDTINKELTSIENNPDTIQNEILNNIDTQNTQYTEETNTEDLKTGNSYPKLWYYAKINVMGAEPPSNYILGTNTQSK